MTVLLYLVGHDAPDAKEGHRVFKIENTRYPRTDKTARLIRFSAEDGMEHIFNLQQIERIHLYDPETEPEMEPAV